MTAITKKSGDPEDAAQQSAAERYFCWFEFQSKRRKAEESLQHEFRKIFPDDMIDEPTLIAKPSARTRPQNAPLSRSTQQFELSL